MSGNITRRGAHSWRLKFDTGRDHATGKRITQFVTVRGTKRQAEAELTRLVAAHNAGTMVEPSKLTVAEYMRAWVDTAEALAVSAKTAERYRQLIERQIVPHLGSHVLQKLRKPVKLEDDPYFADLLADDEDEGKDCSRKKGKPAKARRHEDEPYLPDRADDEDGGEDCSGKKGKPAEARRLKIHQDTPNYTRGRCAAASSVPLQVSEKIRRKLGRLRPRQKAKAMLKCLPCGAGIKVIQLTPLKMHRRQRD